MVLVVLLSFLLVLAAAVTLVIGLLNGGLGLIYVSIGCSLGAGIVLAVAVLRSRPRAVQAFEGPGPLPEEEDTVLATQSRTVRRQEPEEDEEEAEEERPRRREAVAERDGGVSLPIAAYDELKVTEILPLLPELEPEELERVRAHEVGSKNRSRIVGRIEMLVAERTWDSGDEDWEAETRPVPARTAPSLVDDDDFEDEADVDEDLGDDFDEDYDEFPIADYDELKVGEIMPLLPELDDDELELVREREQQGPARGMILQRIDRLLGGAPTAAPARTAPKRAPAKKTAAKKTAARKTTAKRSTAKKTAAKKSTAKKTTAKKTTAARRR